jgi:uncharacterized membrane protein
MERMLVVVFGDEPKTYEGSRALSQLDSEGSISIHAEAVIEKNADGTVTVKQERDDLPIRTIGGTAIGALIGLLGGPIGLGIGAVTGTIAGGIWDVSRTGVDAEFIDEVSAKLTPGSWAIVSEISEEWVTPVDTRMEALGGTVFRTARKNVEKEQHTIHVGVLKADIAQLKAEQAHSRAEQKAKLQAKIDQLNEKLETTLEQATQRYDQQEKEAKAKVQALEKKAAKAKGEAKASIEARIADIRKRAEKDKEDYQDLLNKFPAVKS